MIASMQRTRSFYLHRNKELPAMELEHELVPEDYLHLIAQCIKDRRRQHMAYAR